MHLRVHLYCACVLVCVHVYRRSGTKDQCSYLCRLYMILHTDLRETASASTCTLHYRYTRTQFCHDYNVVVGTYKTCRKQIHRPQQKFTAAVLRGCVETLVCRNSIRVCTVIDIGFINIKYYYIYPYIRLYLFCYTCTILSKQNEYQRSSEQNILFPIRPKTMMVHV